MHLDVRDVALTARDAFRAFGFKPRVPDFRLTFGKQIAALAEKFLRFLPLVHEGALLASQRADDSDNAPDLELLETIQFHRVIPLCVAATAGAKLFCDAAALSKIARRCAYIASASQDSAVGSGLASCAEVLRSCSYACICSCVQ